MPLRRCALLALFVACIGNTGDALTGIAAVQGRADASPFAGRQVTVEGIVTGDFQDRDADASQNLGGFFIQAGAEDPDRSTGLFVYESGRSLPDVSTGDRVRVAGTVKEHYGETQLLASSVQRIGRGRMAPVDIRLPVAVALNADNAPVADLERYEGMLVRIRNELTVTGLDELERFGSLRLAADGRLWQFTQIALPDPAAYREHERQNAARSILLDDGRRNENPDTVRYLVSADGEATRAGDTIAGLTGNLRYARGSGGKGSEGWRLVPRDEPVIRNRNPRPAAPAVAGNLRVASVNVLNYFPTVDAGRNECGPRARDGCRGADSQEELDRQRAKIVSSLAALDADVVGLVELENNAQASLADLVEALNGRLGAGSYDYVATGSIGEDVIKAGLLFKPGTVRPVGPHAVLDAGVDRRFDDRRNRPALAQTFATRSGTGVVTIVVNHFKSKGSPCDDADDPNTGDGQGNCNRTRRAAAAALIDWLASDPTGSGDMNFLVVGDFNAYHREDPMREFQRAGYVNLADGDPASAYSFIHDGQAGALDHALASPSLAPRVAGFAVWHSNADESGLHDYNLDHGRDASIFDAGLPYRSADHDPLLIGLELGRQR